MVDDELLLVAEKVGEGGGNEVGALEGVVLGYFNEGELAALGGEGVRELGQVFLLLEESLSGLQPFGVRSDLRLCKLD